MTPTAPLPRAMPTAATACLHELAAAASCRSACLLLPQMPLERANPLLSCAIGKWLKAHGKVRACGIVRHAKQAASIWATSSRVLPLPSGLPADGQAQAEREPEGRCPYVLQADGCRRLRGH